MVCSALTRSRMQPILRSDQLPTECSYALSKQQAGDDYKNCRGSDIQAGAFMTQWLLIVGILLLAIMPIFWILPSAKQRRQSRQRQYGMQLGFKITLTTAPAVNPETWELVDHAGRPRTPTITVARYALSIAGAPIAASGHWHITRAFNAQAKEGPSLPDTFKWALLPDALSEQHAEQIAHCLTQLPDDVVALERKQQEVAVFWSEAGDTGTVDQLYQSLQPLLAHP